MRDDPANGFVCNIHHKEGLGNVIGGAILGRPVVPEIFADFGNGPHDGHIVICRDTEASVRTEAIVDQMAVVAIGIRAAGVDASGEMIDARMDEVDEFCLGCWGALLES